MVIGDYTVDQVIEKAQTLIEAMPYIKKFQGKTVVVKYGGSAMLDENLKYNVIKDVAMLKLVGMKPVIVHGGGKEISKWVEKVGKEAEFINGLRVTDAETMEIAEHVSEELEGALKRLVWESPVHPSASVVRQWDEWQRECERLQSFIRFFSVFNLSIWRVCLSTEG